MFHREFDKHIVKNALLGGIKCDMCDYVASHSKSLKIDHYDSEFWNSKSSE